MMNTFPFDLDQLTLTQLAESSFQDAVKKEIDKGIRSLDRPMARKLYVTLSQAVKAAPDDVQKVYAPWIRLLSVMALTYLSRTEIVDVIRSNLIFAWRQGVDIIDEIATRVDLEYEESFPELNTAIRGALLQNNEPFGDVAFELINETQPHGATLGRWLQKYDEIIGGGKNDTVKRAEFFQQFPAARQLTREEKELLEEILSMYDDMKPISLVALREEEFEEISAQNIKTELLRRQRELAEQRKQASTVAPITTSPPNAPASSAEKIPPSPSPVSPAPSSAPTSTLERPTPRVPRTFQSLKDLEVVDVNMIRDTGLTIQAFAEGIKQQVSMMAGEDPAAKAQVASLWRSSPLYRLYTEIGRESVITNTTLDLVMQNRKVERKPTLSKDEFSALADLSHSLS